MMPIPRRTLVASVLLAAPAIAPVAALVVDPGAASAHAFLRSATPAVGGTVATAPDAVAIDFTEAVEPLFSTIVVTDRNGTIVSRGAPRLAGSPHALAVALAPLKPGPYTVTWHATSVDTHRTEGRFTFRVGP